MSESNTPTPPPQGAGDESRQARLTPSEELHNYLFGWRQRLPPRSVPGLAAENPRGVSQEDMAWRIGVSVSYYGRLERGEQRNYSADIMDKLASALQLDPAERAMLYLLATGRPAAPITRPANTAVTPTMERVIHAQPWPAYISDAAWDLVVHNKAMAEWFPSMRYVTNVMRFVFCFPDSHRQLVDWETSWAPPMLAQMKAAHRLKPNERLAELVDEVLRDNEIARELWDQTTVHVHPDGDRRWLYLPFTDEPSQVEIQAWTPMRADDLRVVMLIPVDE